MLFKHGSSIQVGVFFQYLPKLFFCYNLSRDAAAARYFEEIDIRRAQHFLFRQAQYCLTGRSSAANMIYVWTDAIIDAGVNGGKIPKSPSYARRLSLQMMSAICKADPAPHLSSLP